MNAGTGTNLRFVLKYLGAKIVVHDMSKPALEEMFRNALRERLANKI